jgi:signal transduction histidine kinase
LLGSTTAAAGGQFGGMRRQAARPDQAEQEVPDHVSFGWSEQSTALLIMDSTQEELFDVVERAKREWESTVDSLPDLVCLIDRDGLVMRANRIVEDWQLGRVAAVRGRALHQLLHADCQDAACYLAALTQQVLDQTLRGEPLDLVAFDPVLDRHVQIHAQPVLDRNRASTFTAVVVVRDVTERQRAEQERERLIADLDAYAHTVAHDLKNPAGVIIGFAEMLERDLESMPPDDLSSCVQAIARSGRKLIGIIDELLLFAQVQRAEVETGPLDMTAVVAEALYRLSDLATRCEAEISVPETWPTAIGHAQWIEEVWTNYISNAIKYGGQPPRVEIGSDVQPDGQLRFWVRDNGAGIAPDVRAQLFAPFTRFAPARASGHGLGLSIVQRIIEKLGGQVGFVSDDTPGAGSLFYFTLPAAYEWPFDRPDLLKL